MQKGAIDPLPCVSSRWLFCRRSPRASARGFLLRCGVIVEPNKLGQINHAPSITKAVQKRAASGYNWPPAPVGEIPDPATFVLRDNNPSPELMRMRTMKVGESQIFMSNLGELNKYRDKIGDRVRKMNRRGFKFRWMSIPGGAQVTREA